MKMNNWLRDPIVWLVVGIALLVTGIVIGIMLIASIAKGKKELAARQSKPHEKSAAPRAYAYSYSIIGNRRSQQDYCIVTERSFPERLVRERGCFAIVCDGMGGMRGGERASRLCAELLSGEFHMRRYESPAVFYRTLIPHADSAVAMLTDEEGNRLGGGTTLVSVIVKDGVIYYASVGDSRIYLYRDNTLTQLTRDHNYLLRLMERVQSGEISTEEAMSDRQREALISYIGMGTGPDIVDVNDAGIQARIGDIIVLCSDGLYKALSSEEIAAVIAKNKDNPEMLPQELISTAFSKKHIRHDNITVAVMSYK